MNSTAEFPDILIDAIFDGIDFLSREGNISEIEETLKEIDISKAHTDELLTYLTATLPVRERCGYRAEFYSLVEAELKSRPNYNDGLLEGLE